MEPAHYTDPLEDALSHGSQRVAQLASLVGAMAQVVMQRRALADARRSARADQHALRVLGDQERLLHQQTRLTWAPAHDPQWLAHADLLQVARAWANAAASADADPSAEAAQRKCEDRLRKLHPYAMARYDRLRSNGMGPLDAMSEAAPLFAYSPTTRTGDPAPTRLALETGTSPDDSLAADMGPAEPGPQPGADGMDPAELRGWQIIDRLQARARASGRPDLRPDELAMILEAVTNLPSDVIDRLTWQTGMEARARNEDHHAATAEQARAAHLDSAVDLPTTPAADEYTTGMTAAYRDTGIADTARAHAGADRSAAQLAAQSFPHTATEAVRIAAATRGNRAAAAPGKTQAPHKAKRQGRSL
ncbi:MAG TPA: hypothetical protein VNF47_22260 [Streptosporangiaceae bacterium]|nr:hypothetical protein [Streptosporangiaceae bacterium]